MKDVKVKGRAINIQQNVKHAKRYYIVNNYTERSSKIIIQYL